MSDYSASPNLSLRPLVVEGVAFLPGIRNDKDVDTVLRYTAQQFHNRVEKLENPGCWGFSYRINRNSPGVISNHGRGIAIDVNAPKHPNGVSTSRTFTSAQINEIHEILAELKGVVRWGGDYNGTPDAMHFEIVGTRAAVARVAAELNGGLDMDEKTLRGIVREEATAAIKAELDRPVDTKLGPKSIRQQLKETLQRFARADAKK